MLTFFRMSETEKHEFERMSFEDAFLDFQFHLNTLNNKHSKEHKMSMFLFLIYLI